MLLIQYWEQEILLKTTSLVNIAGVNWVLGWYGGFEMQLWLH